METVGHFVLDCKRIRPVLSEEEFGLSGALEFEMEGGSVDLRVT